MPMIQMTPELLKSKATEVRTLRSQHDEVMAKMTSLVHALDEHWKGEAQTAFVAKFDSMKTTFDNFSEMLENYAKMMDTAATNVNDTDQNLKNVINSAN